MNHIDYPVLPSGSFSLIVVSDRWSNPVVKTAIEDICTNFHSLSSEEQELLIRGNIDDEQWLSDCVTFTQAPAFRSAILTEEELDNLYSSDPFEPFRKK